MSNNNTPAHRSTPGVPGDRVPSPSLTEVYEALQLLSLSSPTQSGGESSAAENRRARQYSLPIPYPRINGDEDGEGVAL